MQQVCGFKHRFSIQLLLHSGHSKQHLTEVEGMKLLIFADDVIQQGGVIK